MERLVGSQDLSSRKSNLWGRLSLKEQMKFPPQKRRKP